MPSSACRTLILNLFGFCVRPGVRALGPVGNVIRAKLDSGLGAPSPREAGPWTAVPLGGTLPPSASGGNCRRTWPGRRLPSRSLVDQPSPSTIPWVSVRRLEVDFTSEINLMLKLAFGDHMLHYLHFLESGSSMRKLNPKMLSQWPKAEELLTGSRASFLWLRT